MCGIRCHLSLPVAACVLFVALPYTVCIITQLIYGWPKKPGFKRHTEALKPRRIYRLTVAVLDSLRFLQYGRLYLQLKLWYHKEENLKLYRKGVAYGRRGNRLDLYHPPDRTGRPPVVVFIYGGAWGSGERSLYCLLARQMAEELNAAVLCPDYSTYPKGNVLAMVQDVADCLVWAQENGQKFSFDKENVVLVGHSAGAHLCALTVLFLVAGREELFIEAKTQQELARAVRGVIGLSGVYNIQEHYEHEQRRAVEYVSTMHKAMNGEENFAFYSPFHVVKQMSREHLDRMPPFALLHGTGDAVVPVESSSRFSELLTALSVKVSLYLLPEANHSGVVTDLMLPSRPFYHLLFGCIKQEFRKFLLSP